MANTGIAIAGGCPVAVAGGPVDANADRDA
jgi:hypothetical protein